MKIKYVIIILSVAIILSLIFPTIYYFENKEIQSLPEFVSYEQAIYDSLPQKIETKAAQYNCRNYILPVSIVQNNPGDLPSIVEDLNIALTSYPNWKLSVSKRIKEKIMSRREDQLTKWGGMLSGSELKNILNTQRNVSMSTDYSAEAKLTTLQNDNGNDLQLIVVINKEITMSKLFDIRVSFAHPKTVKEWKNNIHERTNKLIQMKLKSTKGLYAASIFTILLLILIFLTSTKSIIEKVKKRGKIKEVLNQIETRQELIDNGHYVAALDLANMYLKFFPDNIEIKAFKERLLDFTNNDPKTAQIAYVEAKKLELRLSNRKNQFLSITEKDDLKNLLPYNPDLRNSYENLLELEYKEKERTDLKDNTKDIKKLISSGKLDQAINEISDLEITYPESAILQEIKKSVLEKIDKLKLDFVKINQQISDLRIINAKKDLQYLLKYYSDYKEAILLDEAFRSSSELKDFSLVSEKFPIITVLQKNEVVIGRFDEDVHPDIIIDNKYISRPHTKISLIDNKVMIEDMESTGGTYINGDKIQKQNIKDGDLITLAKVVDITISVYRNNSVIDSIMLEVDGKTYLMVSSKIECGIKGKRIILGRKDFCLERKEGYLVYKVNEDNYQLLLTGVDIVINNLNFTVKKADNNGGK